MNSHIQNLIHRYPSLRKLESAVMDAYALLTACSAAGGKLLLCGNGGSACDCEHIAGELMKGFIYKRRFGNPSRLRSLYSERTARDWPAACSVRCQRLFYPGCTD